MDQNSKIEIIEQDTAELEDIPNMWEFLLPQGLPKCQQFNINFNKGLLDGWVKQPSPCCGAASIAGAWNCLSGLGRLDACCMSHREVLEVYIFMFKESIKKKQEAFSRKLGVSAGSLFEMLLKELNALGYYLKVQKPKIISKLNLRKLLIKLTFEYRREHPMVIDCNIADTYMSDLTLTPHPLDCLYGLFGDAVMSEYAHSIELDPAAGTVSSPVEDADQTEEPEPEDEEGKDGADGEVPDVISISAKGTKLAAGFAGKVKSIPHSSKPWNYVHDIHGILKTMSGLDRLLNQDKPSTTAIGNWGLLQVKQREK